MTPRISNHNLMPRSPLGFLLIAWLYLDRYQASDFAIGIFACFGAIAVIAWGMEVNKAKRIDLFKLFDASKSHE